MYDTSTTHTRRRGLWRGNHHRCRRANELGGRRRGGGHEQGGGGWDVSEQHDARCVAVECVGVGESV